MQFIRSFIFNLYVYVATLVLGIICLPTLLLPSHRLSLKSVETWARSLRWGLKFFCKISHQIVGLENLGNEPVLIAAKHQSMWETAMLFTLIKNPAFVLKRELMWIPIIGWYCLKCGMIPVDRTAGAKALRSMVAIAKERLESGRSVVIFPEGTRRAPDAEPAYKPGVAALYTRLNKPCVPVATNSGFFWPRRTIIKNPGTITLQFLPAINPSLKRREFSQRLEQEIELASRDLAPTNT